MVESTTQLQEGFILNHNSDYVNFRWGFKEFEISEGR